MTCIRSWTLARALLCALIVGAIPARAQMVEEADPRQRYEVAGPPEGAALPRLRQPGLGSEVVLELGAGASGLVLSGAAMRADGVRWVEVLRGGGTWAEASRLRARPGDPETGFPLLCTGAEPFWSLAIEGEEAVFEAPDVPRTEWMASAWLPARGRTGRHMIRLSSGYGIGYLALLRQACSDGMSDIAYPYETILITAGQAVRAGCCRRAGDEPGNGSDGLSDAPREEGD
jgi:uncharacterized membrane protein